MRWSSPTSRSRWPATEEDYKRASAVIPDEFVRDIKEIIDLFADGV